MNRAGRSPLDDDIGSTSPLRDEAVGPWGEEAGDDTGQIDLAVDGRTRRRDRNRVAVVDALLALYTEGNPTPSSDEIAARAGLSPRSLFRYFDDLDDLTRVAVARHFERVVPLARIDVGPSAPLGERIDAIVASRMRTFDFVAPVARVARWRAQLQPVVADEVDKGRRLLRQQALSLFEQEIGRLPAERRATIGALVDVLLSFEVAILLREADGGDAAATHSVIAEGLRLCLGG